METSTGGAWQVSATKLNHYDGDSDNPRWIVEDTASGGLSRNVESLSGDLTATTSKTGDVVLQLTNLHGDVNLVLPLEAGKTPTVLDADEYGNPRDCQNAARYGWLGAKQRSAETVTGVALMGARLYNPSLGRFLQVDPVPGGSDNAYEYCRADGINCTDLDGRKANSYEKKLCKRRPGECFVAESARRWATRQSRKATTSNRKEAYRHCLISALLTWHLGKRHAWDWLNAHEGTYDTADHRRDMKKNATGVGIGSKIRAWTWIGARRKIKKACRRAYDCGDLWIMGRPSRYNRDGIYRSSRYDSGHF